MKKYVGWILLFLVLAGCDPAPIPIPNVERPVAPDIGKAETSESAKDTSTISVLAWNIESGRNGYLVGKVAEIKGPR